MIGAPIVLAPEMPFTIGMAEFNPPTREVIFNGDRSAVEPRVMQFLVALHRADGGVVSRDDLIILCWEGRIVGDDAINRVVSRARAVSEKQAGGQFRIETITKVGFRLISGDGAPSVEVEAAPAKPNRIDRRGVIAGGAALGTALAAGIGWTLLKSDPTPREARLLVDDARKTLREGDIDDARTAIGTLRQATRLAPRSAEAWGLLALASTIAITNASARERPDLRARALAAMKNAFALEPGQADALAARLRSSPMYRNWYSYERACRAALRGHPNHPELVLVLANLLREVGRLREALQLYEKLVQEMPLSADILISRAEVLWSLGSLGEADAAIDNAFGLRPRNYNVWNTKASYLLFNGRPRDALAMYLDVDGRPFGGDDLDYQLSIMQAKAIASGDRKLIRETNDALVTVAESGKGFILAGAMFAAFVGDVDQAFRLLNALYFNRGFRVPGFYFDRAYSNFGGELHTANLFCRMLSPIRRDPPFGALTREIGLDDYWARTASRSLVVA
jgi:DNA-binding winged helix-turn-helix (wHTH) protein/tetratricopeptide (TPR) repeat protein